MSTGHLYWDKTIVVGMVLKLIYQFRTAVPPVFRMKPLQPRMAACHLEEYPTDCTDTIPPEAIEQSLDLSPSPRPTFHNGTQAMIKRQTAVAEPVLPPKRSLSESTSVLRVANITTTYSPAPAWRRRGLFGEAILGPADWATVSLKEFQYPEQSFQRRTSILPTWKLRKLPRKVSGHL